MTPEPGCDPCTRAAPPGVAEGFRAEWRTETVVGLTRGIRDDYAFERIPILADALEEAGCTDERVLCHCREPNTHARNCWAMRLALDQYLPPATPRPPAPRPPVVVPVPQPISVPYRTAAPSSDNRAAIRFFVVMAMFFLLKSWTGSGSKPSPVPPRADAPVRFVPAPVHPPMRSFDPAKPALVLPGTEIGPLFDRPSDGRSVFPLTPKPSAPDR